MSCKVFTIHIWVYREHPDALWKNGMHLHLLNVPSCGLKRSIVNRKWCHFNIGLLSKLWTVLFDTDQGIAIHSLHDSPICREALDLAAIWMKTLPNSSTIVRFVLFKTTDLAIGEYIVMLHSDIFNCQFEALPSNGRPCKEWIKGMLWYEFLHKMVLDAGIVFLLKLVCYGFRETTGVVDFYLKWELYRYDRKD